MGEENRTLEVGSNDVNSSGPRRVTFIGVDWGAPGGDWTALRCPQCATRHQWQSRRPKRCRHCGVRFLYTANESRACIKSSQETET